MTEPALEARELPDAAPAPQAHDHRTETDALPVDPADVEERVLFEELERETTQPARHFSLPLENADAEDRMAPASATASGDASEFEDAVAAPQHEPVPAADAAPEPSPASAPSVDEIPGEAFATRAFPTDQPDEPTVPEAVELVSEPAAAEPAGELIEPPLEIRFEPQPFDIPAPLEEQPPPTAELAAATPELHEPIRSTWSPAEPALQASIEPTQSIPAAYLAAPALSIPEPAQSFVTSKPEPRNYRDLARRGLRLAAFVAGGWFIAVLVLIAAYRFVNPPFSMLMATQWVTGTPIRKQWVPLDEISPNLARSVIASEDSRFCQHWGVDFVEAAHAIRRATDGYPRGASTITMQVAKNLFLFPAKSYVRKLAEIPLTFIIELAWPKRRILEIYLNIVEWGPGVFGAEAAARTHFKRPAASLTARQAAQLAVALPNPIVRRAGAPGPRMARQASVVQARAAGSRASASCVLGQR